MNLDAYGKKTLQLERPRPVIALEYRGVPDGRFMVWAHVANGRGVRTDDVEVVSSFNDLHTAQRCRDNVNRQHTAFQSFIFDRKRTPERDALENK